MTRLAGRAAFPAGQEPSPAAEPLPSPDAMSDALREILAGSEFASPALPARRRIFEWIANTLSDAWDWLRRFLFEEGGGVMEVMAVLVVLAALVALGAVALRRGPQWVHRVRGTGDEGPEDDGAPVSAREWLGLARTRAGEGEFRPAASALYQGFLLTLDGNGAVAFHPSKTPGDYALEMETGAGRSFIRHFQGLSFGQETPTPAGYEALEDLARDAGCPTPASSEEADSS
ncbi:hypothetical protein [Candidatus Palauibacter polyketidifaciens]|uniref:DUF4129 domain-containing protein n=1 Tax=Candidatus Palauibacter polyketidifaciens TaxID=3056740 RepID=UPI00139BC69A|nr:hypothetical protein [Candidatus Palauibacter polyketidifaciens]MDE2721656.1 hypothetical protein [Candidatus Palauibacter polyketidifaciens]MYE34507.1 hypothetical protein [Gemmatimonadales bacterium]